MSNHRVGGKTLRNPVPLDHALGDDPPLLVRLHPDKTLDHLIPFPADVSAVIEGVCVFPSNESMVQYLVPHLKRQHLKFANSEKRRSPFYS